MENELAESTDRNHEVWDLWFTLLWALVIFVFYAMAQFIAFMVVLIRESPSGDIGSTMANIDMELLTNGNYIWPTVLISSLFGILAIWIAVKLRKGSHFNSYMALIPGNLKAWITWSFVFAACLFVLEWLTETFDVFEDPFTAKVIGSTNNLAMLILSIGFIGPIFEELLFRGFLFKGLLSAGINHHLVVIITSLAFALPHLQYNFYIILLIIPMGLVLGYSRWYSKGLFLPILLHIINNTLTTLIYSTT